MQIPSTPLFSKWKMRKKGMKICRISGYNFLRQEKCEGVVGRRVGDGLTRVGDVEIPNIY